MAKYFLFAAILSSILLSSSCRDDFETVPSSGDLEFSQDTLYLDTVFSNISSSTYHFKVYNRSNDDISIPKIELGQNENSNYRLNVDGIPGKSFENIEILANDSIFVFVEVTADIEALASQGTQFLYEDDIIFQSSNQNQQVHLVSLIQDAVFLYPERFEDGSTESILLGIDEEGNEQRIEGFILDDENLHFTNEKPYVIYGFAGVGSGKTLEIDPGARIHFHEDSGIIVANNASLHANGEASNDDELMENQIVFEGDRLEPEFSNTPGQWSAIWLTQGSTNHRFSHTTIKNGTVGILMDSNDGSANPTLQIDNTQIYNSATVGLLARTGFIDAENLVIGNAGQAALNLSLGGNYEFRHSTFANYWNFSFRQFPSVLIENNMPTSEGVLAADLEKAKFDNCIIYGSENIELLFNRVVDAEFNFEFNNTLIRFNDFNNNYSDNELYNFDDANLFSEIILNEAPQFKNPATNDFRIGIDSGAKEIGNETTGQAVPVDLLGTPRSIPPDAGAYQSIDFEE
ncbi:MAG: hypothetical protein ACQESK_02210 [Bacteroidota bacterium]